MANGQYRGPTCQNRNCLPTALKVPIEVSDRHLVVLFYEVVSLPPNLPHLIVGVRHFDLLRVHTKLPVPTSRCYRDGDGNARLSYSMPRIGKHCCGSQAAANPPPRLHKFV